MLCVACVVASEGGAVLDLCTHLVGEVDVESAMGTVVVGGGHSVGVHPVGGYMGGWTEPEGVYILEGNSLVVVLHILAAGAFLVAQDKKECHTDCCHCNYPANRDPVLDFSQIQTTVAPGYLQKYSETR